MLINADTFLICCLKVLQWNKTISSKPDPPSAAILMIYLDRAQDLPVSSHKITFPSQKVPLFHPKSLFNMKWGRAWV